MTYNPLARQRRLAQALADLRDERGWNHAELSRRSGLSPSMISRIENPFGDIGRRPNLINVRKLLDALGVDRRSDLFVEIEGYAEVVASRRWWDATRYSGMGAGQKTFALVELGAETIAEYAAGLLPGLVQTEAYARHRVGAAGGTDVDAVVAGRLGRQQQVDDQGTAYQLVIEEQAIRRYPVPRPVMLEQLHHLLALGKETGHSIRVVPVNGDLGDGPAPRAPYAHMIYPVPDPAIVIVDGVADPHLVTSVDEVEEYAQLHRRLRGAALSDADSAALVQQVADDLAATI